MSKILLPGVPPHLLSLIHQKAQEEEEENDHQNDENDENDENVQILVTPNISFVPLPLEPLGYGYFHYHQLKEQQQQNHHSLFDDQSSNLEQKSKNSSEENPETFHVASSTTDNYYQILGFPPNINPHTITNHQIKKAYKKAALKWHPDKLPNKDDTMFKKVNRAWEVLGTSKTAKIQYDSSLPFDDSIPTYDESWDKNDERFSVFFKKFGAAFERWSTLATCPRGMIVKLGDIDSSKKHVEAFYHFWNVVFKSWRDFGYLNEYDETNADCREERRWMQRQNAKMNLTKKKEEREKLKALVALCKKLDPRVKKFQREEAELREKLRIQKEEEALAREKARVEREERERLEKERLEREKIEEEKRIQREKQKLRSEFLALQKQLRQMCQPYVSVLLGAKKSGEIPAEDVEFVVARLKSAEELTGVISRLDQLPQDKFVPQFEKCVKALRKRDEEASRERQQQMDSLQKQQQQAMEEREWTREELVLLTKAIVKFPGGTSERWKRVSEMVGTRTPDEVQKMTGDIKKGKTNAGKLIGQKKKEIVVTDTKEVPREWTKEEQKAFEDALRKHKALKGDEKWQAVADELKDRSLQECKDRFEWCKEMAKKKVAAKK